MNFTDLQPIQLALDEHVLENHGNTHESTKEDMLLALLVELAETAQETRCFKHWSTKGPSERSVILEEYVDVLHFMLSRCNYYNVDLREYKSDEYNHSGTKNLNLTQTFLNVFSWVSLLSYAKDEVNDLKGAVNAFIALGELLEFTEDEIRQAYMDKNEVNYQRQKDGY